MNDLFNTAMRCSRGLERAAFRALPLLLTVCLWSSSSASGSLQFYEGSSSPGSPRLIASPANSVVLDLKYDATTAEGTGIYGFSETLFMTTGDVTFSASGFVCPAYSCLFYPLPFTAGNSIVLTAGDDLAGEFGAAQDLVLITIEGTQGHVVVVDGSYVDTTGAGGEPGEIRGVNLEVLATVPEPTFATGLGIGALLLGWARKRPMR